MLMAIPTIAFEHFLAAGIQPDDVARMILSVTPYPFKLIPIWLPLISGPLLSGATTRL